jgi:para-nitrobenzyl esterase
MTAAMLASVGDVPRDAPVAEILTLQLVAEQAPRGFGLVGKMQPLGVQYGFHPLPDESNLERAWRDVARRVDVLIGCTRDETGVIAALLPALRRLFRLPVVGRLTRWLITTPLNRRIYETQARQFAARHRHAGGIVHSYRMIWRPRGNGYSAAHLTRAEFARTGTVPDVPANDTHQAPIRVIPARSLSHLVRGSRHHYDSTNNRRDQS